MYTQNDANRAKADTTFRLMSRKPCPLPQLETARRDFGNFAKGGVDSQFIQDAVPEFVLYWLERGEVSKTWNNRFLKHVRTQWLHFTHAEQHSTAPTAISEDWRPSDDCLDIINMALIDRQFAESLVPEFVLYWRDSNQLHTSWNSRFCNTLNCAGAVSFTTEEMGMDPQLLNRVTQQLKLAASASVTPAGPNGTSATSKELIAAINQILSCFALTTTISF